MHTIKVHEKKYMGNGEEEVKSVADYITSDNDHDGVGEAVEKFVLKV